MEGRINVLVLSLFLVLLFPYTVIADNMDTTGEPLTMTLLGMGLLGIAGISKKMFQK